MEMGRDAMGGEEEMAPLRERAVRSGQPITRERTRGWIQVWLRLRGRDFRPVALYCLLV